MSASARWLDDFDVTAREHGRPIFSPLTQACALGGDEKSALLRRASIFDGAIATLLFSPDAR